VLIAPGSVTHHSDMSQRYFEMTRTVVSGRRSNSPPGTQHRALLHAVRLTNGGIPSNPSGAFQ